MDDDTHDPEPPERSPVDRMVEELRRVGDEDFFALMQPDNVRGLRLLREVALDQYERLLHFYKERRYDVRSLRSAVNKLDKADPLNVKGDEAADASAFLRDIIESAELWKDTRGQPYATIVVETADGRTHHEHIGIKGQAFADWIGRRYWQATGSAVSDKHLREAVALARARALYDGAQHRTWIRTAEADGTIYIDLADADWTVVEVDKDGWRIADEVPVRFRRSGDEMPLPIPIRADRQDTIAKLQRLINLKRPEDVVLLIGWMVAAMRPGRPSCILLIVCEPGSAKTTTLRIVCSVTDPRVAQESSIPPSEWDIAVTSYSLWVVAWDNVGLIGPDVADACCRIVTGGGSRKRALYTDEGSHAIDMRRPMVMTGLRMPSARSDYVDRSLVVDLAIIGEGKYRTEQDIEVALQELRPALFGLLLDGVSAGLRNEEATRALLPRLPRMADFMTWVEAAGEAFGWASGDFLSAYEAAYDVRMAEAAEDDPLLNTIADYMRKRCARDPEARGAIEGKAAELLSELRKHAEQGMRTNQWGDRVGKSPADAKWFPPNPRGLSVQLQNNRKPLKALGIIWSKRPDPSSSTAGQLHRLEMTEEAARAVNSTPRQARQTVGEPYFEEGWE